ncbi:MAG: Uma2 family endonuclease [Acidimicrobiales bacterium]
MKTVVLDPLPAVLDQLIAHRQAAGLDTFDEVWEGTYHMSPAPRSQHAYLDDEIAGVLRPYARAAGLFGSGPFNLGVRDDYRVPDRGYHRALLDVVYLDTAAIVVEIVSPHDESYEKLPFYASRGVDEVFLVEGPTRRIHVHCLGADGYEEALRSTLLDVDAATLERAITWPGP